MKSKVLLAIGVGALLAAPALAGLNPAAPGLPTVTDAAFSASVTNNQISAMCVDCHTVAPKPTGGSHYVNTLANGATNSGGSGIGTTGSVVVSDNGRYFKTSNWDVDTLGMTWPSKYGAGYVSVINQLPAGVASTTATVQAVAVGNDIICESCHNIVGNDDGGNNLLVVQMTDTWETSDDSIICVGCHGYMYTLDAANSINNPKYSSAMNTNDFGGGAKGNNEYHWVLGTAYNQNHHAMTSDAISAAAATAGLLWTDNLVIAYADHVTDNTGAAGGTAGQKAVWDHSAKPTGGGLNCVNCHAPAHGLTGATTSPAASILRGGTYTTLGNDLAGNIDRISDRNYFKGIDDRVYCNQCHL